MILNIHILLLFRQNTQDNSYVSLKHNEGEWLVDHDTGIVTFYSSMNLNIDKNLHITPNNPPYNSFINMMVK